jgi:hypothetical protein
MSKTDQAAGRTAEDGGASTAPAQRRPAAAPIMSNAEVRDVVSRARRMQARAIAELFVNLGK